MCQSTFLRRLSGIFPLHGSAHKIKKETLIFHVSFLLNKRRRPDLNRLTLSENTIKRRFSAHLLTNVIKSVSTCNHFKMLPDVPTLNIPVFKSY